MKLFVNLPVKDLDKAMAFFKALGFTFNPQFTDETAACMVMGADNYAMLLTHDKFKSFAKKPMADAHKQTGMMLAVALDSKEDVDRIMAAGLKAGGQEPSPAQDHGFMYQRTLEDLDGHIWEPFWMDPNFVQQPQS
jgi:uncharacterized protein